MWPPPCQVWTASLPGVGATLPGVRPTLPDKLADLFEREERFDTLANELSAVQDLIRTRIVLSGAA